MFRNVTNTLNPVFGQQEPLALDSNFGELDLLGIEGEDDRSVNLGELCTGQQECLQIESQRDVDLGLGSASQWMATRFCRLSRAQQTITRALCWEKQVRNRFTRAMQLSIRSHASKLPFSVEI